MDLFRDIKKGRFGSNPKLKREARHELDELGGEALANKFEKHVKGLKPGSKMKALDKMKGKVGMGTSHITGKKYNHN